MINWNCTKEEVDLIVEVGRRYEKEISGMLSGDDWRNLFMDLHACHCNGCPLDLQAMLTMPLPDFGHDIGGIQRHINRETGQLENCFVPRAAKKETPQ